MSPNLTSVPKCDYSDKSKYYRSDHQRYQTYFSNTLLIANDIIQVSGIKFTQNIKELMNSCVGFVSNSFHGLLSQDKL